MKQALLGRVELNITRVRHVVRVARPRQDVVRTDLDMELSAAAQGETVWMERGLTDRFQLQRIQ